MSNRRAVRPLNPAARQAADDEMYRRHESDPRPNSLFDEHGNRRPLDADDPSQSDLRSEWMDLYVANGGEVEGGAAGGTGESGDESASDETPTDDPVEHCPPEDEPTITVQWARNGAHTDFVIPDMNPSGGVSAAGAVAGVAPASSIVQYDFEFEQADAPAAGATQIKFTPPDDCLVSPLVQTTNVPDGTSAAIQILHCETGEQVQGGSLEDLEVQGGKVVRSSTGNEPKVSFRFAQDPWRSFDKPFFHFRASVDYRGLQGETPSDFSGDEGNCLRVRYQHSCIGFTGDGIAASVRTKCTRAKNDLESVPHSAAVIHHFNSYTHSEAAFGSFFRNTYAVFSDSHGTLIHRTNNTSVPAHDYSELPPVSATDYKSVVCFTPSPYIDGADVANNDYFVSVPRYLYYISSCLSGFESSLADGFINGGCQNVIAYQKVIYTNKGERMARRFFTEWAGTHQLDPAKIPDAFLEAGSGLRDDLRPILYPQSLEPSAGLSAGAIAAIVLGAIAIVAIGVLIGAAAFGLL